MILEHFEVTIAPGRSDNFNASVDDGLCIKQTVL